jgi:hypothetical protein
LKRTTRKPSRSKPSARRVWKRETWGKKTPHPYGVLALRYRTGYRKGRFRKWAKIRPKPRKAPLRRFAKITYEEHEAPSRWERGRHPSREPSRARAFAERKLRGRGVAIYDSEKRFEFHGTGKQLQRAVAKSKNRHRGKVPKGYIRVSAESYLDDSARYEEDGDWSPFVKVESL